MTTLAPPAPQDRGASALVLRVRERVVADEPAPTDAFVPSRYGERSSALSYRGRRREGAGPSQLVLDELEGTSVRMSRARMGPVIHVGDDPLLPVFFASARCGIPAIGADTEPGEVVSWNFRHTDHGVLVLSSLDEDGLPRPSRGLTLVAALLPLTLTPAVASAAPGVGGALPVLHQLVDAPAKAKSKAQPEPTSKAEPEAAAASEPVAEPGAGATVPNAAAVDPNTGPDAATEAPRVTAPGPQSSGGGVWAALVGSDVRLTLADGSVFSGRLLGVHNSVLVAAREGDGLVVAVDQRQVSQANVVTRNDDERPRVLPRAPGTGLLIGGAIMTGIAGGLLIGGIAAGAYCAVSGGRTYYGYYGSYSGGGNDGCWQYWVPFVVPGVALAGGGIPMIVIGKRKRDKWKREVGVAQLAPQLTRTKHGWSGGLTLRF